MSYQKMTKHFAETIHGQHDKSYANLHRPFKQIHNF